MRAAAARGGIIWAVRDFDRGRGTLVALHGHGDDPASARAWGRRIAPQGWEVVAPGAPVDGAGARSWFATGPRGVVADDLGRSLARVAHLVDSVRSSGRRIVVAGFSQGAALALALARDPALAQPDAVVAVCGFLAEGEGIAEGAVADAVVAGGRPPVLVVGASRDEVVPAFLGEDAAAVLSAEGLEVTTATVDAGHEVDHAAEVEVRRWLDQRLDPGVRISLQLPVDRVQSGGELVSGDAISDLASGFEKLGADAVFVTDHPAPDVRWLAGGGHHALEPTVALAAAAVATRQVRLHTNVYVLPYRNPFLAAKALASVDVVSGGRLIVGVAAGYLRSEFSALGAGFEDRTERLEDALAVLPRIWSGEEVTLEGPGYDARSVAPLPLPVQRPHPPIWVGGNSPAAMRRAVSSAQGWSPFPTPAGLERAVRTSRIADLEELSARLVRAREMCEEVGRTDPLTICFAPFSLGAYLEDPAANRSLLVDEVAALGALGVDWVTVGVPGRSRREVLEAAEDLLGAIRP